ncbi:MAG: hypothetical protein DI586_07785 [Micavibrio aeruginosavorus]|uniref:Pilus formation protein N-terminal domain-containing protein n=1 Tax=Micavibrio aeruginosavorus TaxID=349221 RepID=A0A2W5HAM9_9BACT|nr:MAG: hypothetical protein DI586_07785 [Micavibrio aeruginosavorus]
MKSLILSTGVKSLAFAALMSLTCHQAHAESGLAKYKTQLEAAAASAKPVPVEQQEITSPPLKNVDAIDQSELEDIDELPPIAEDSLEIEPLRVSLDKPEIIRLDRDAVNVIVGSNENLRVVPDTNRNLVLIAKKPGSTYFRALDTDGKVIMQRHVIIGSPTKNYIRIRRACANGTQGCKQYSVYYCPDMCHEVNVVQDASGPGAAIPEETPSGPSNTGAQADLNEDLMETPKTEEPPPGE